MNRYKILMLFPLLLCVFEAGAQNKYEREHRIRKKQFPQNALEFIAEELNDARKVRFYRETDSTKTSFEAKFKKDRLHYSVEFNKDGILEDVEIRVGEVDIPRDSFNQISTYLETKFKKYRVLKIQQQYPVSSEEPFKTTLRNAFQNLLLPGIRYELMISGKTDKAYFDYEVLFDAEGNFLDIRRAVPPNYDHVLY